MQLTNDQFQFVKYIDVSKAIKHYRNNCGEKEGLRSDQVIRAKAFKGDDFV